MSTRGKKKSNHWGSIFMFGGRYWERGAAVLMVYVFSSDFPPFFHFFFILERPNGFQKPWTHLSRKRHPQANNEMVGSDAHLCVLFAQENQ